MNSSQTPPPGAWSRRRAKVQAEAVAIEKAEHQAEVSAGHAALAEGTEAETLAELELPQPDDMKAGDDFTAFMKDTVPTALRNRALRRLWLSNPALANIDNLVDYGEDFAAEAKMCGVVKTIYKVGKGLLVDREEQEEQEIVQTAPEVSEPHDIEMQDHEPDTELMPQEPDGFETDTDMEYTVASQEDLPPVAIKRRMKFRFSDTEAAPSAIAGMNEQ